MKNVRITVEYLDQSKPTRTFEVDSVETDYCRDGWYIRDGYGPAIAYLPALDSRVEIVGFNGPAIHRSEGDLKEIRVDRETARVVSELESRVHAQPTPPIASMTEEEKHEYFVQLANLAIKGQIGGGSITGFST